MIVDARRSLHLAVGVGLRPSGSKARLGEAIRSAVLPVKDHVAPHVPLGLVLALSPAEVAHLRTGDALQRLRAELEAAGLYVVGLNGRAFRGGSDWRDPERTRFTTELARILADWLAPEAAGAIGTLPLAAEYFHDPRVADAMVRELGAFAESAREIFDTTGRRISLALEPAPHAPLATVDDVIAFFSRHLGHLGAPLRGYVGVGLGGCQVATVYEDPVHAVERLARESIPILRVRMGSALRVVLPSVVTARAPLAAQLRAFATPAASYPVMERHGSGTVRYLGDLADVVEEFMASLAYEWRIGYPIPVHRHEAGCLDTAQKEASALVFAALREGVRTFEIDGSFTLADTVRDFRWVRDKVGSLRSRPRRAA